MNKDYSPLYEALDFRIDPDDVKTFNQLKTLLERYGFLTAKTTKGNKNISAESWSYLKGKAVSVEKQTGVVRERKTGKRKDRVLTYTVEYKGKTYERGQTPPKDMPSSPYRFILNRGIPVKQATVGITYKGKKYRKGQFLPKDLKVS